MLGVGGFILKDNIITNNQFIVDFISTFYIVILSALSACLFKQ